MIFFNCSIIGKFAQYAEPYPSVGRYLACQNIFRLMIDKRKSLVIKFNDINT